MMIKKSNEQSLRDAIEDLLKTYRLDQGLDKSRLKERWEELMGPALAKRARIISLDRGKLIIKTDSSALRNELDMAKSKIAERLNEALGKDVVKEVVLV